MSDDEIRLRANSVIRICLKCKHSGEEEKNFMYLRDGVWSCNRCFCKYTEVKEVVDTAIEDANGN